jgi:hypothetical protein
MRSCSCACRCECSAAPFQDVLHDPGVVGVRPGRDCAGPALGRGSGSPAQVPAQNDSRDGRETSKTKAKSSAVVAQASPGHEARDGRSGIEPYGQLGGSKADEKFGAGVEGLIGQHEHSLRGQIERAVPYESLVRHPAHAAPEVQGATDLPSPIGRNGAAAGADHGGRQEARWTDQRGSSAASRHPGRKDGCRDHGLRVSARCRRGQIASTSLPLACSDAQG